MHDLLPWDADALTETFWPRDTMPDDRLYRRLRKMVRRLLGAGVPPTTRGANDRRGEIRLGNNPRLRPAHLGDGPRAQLLASLQSLRRFVVASDTTEADLHGRGEPADAGPLRSNHARGYVVHAAVAIDPQDRRPLGLLAAEVWTRSWQLRAQDHKERAYESKESRKWARLRTRVLKRLRAAGLDARAVFVEDRESDVYENLQTARRRRHPLVSRATHNRAITQAAGGVWPYVQQRPWCVRWSLSIVQQRDGQRSARTATVELRWSRVTLKPPRRKRGRRRLTPLSVTAVLVQEVDAPQGFEPLEWRLLTTVPVYDGQDALAVVHAYACRWGCELFFDLLKNACALEEWNVKQPESLERILAVVGPVAAQIARWTYGSRVTPNQPASDVVDEPTLSDLKQACRYHRIPLPRRPWTLGDLVSRLAQLGGWEPRPGRPPGWRTVLKGWTRFLEFQRILHFARQTPPPAGSSPRAPPSVCPPSPRK